MESTAFPMQLAASIVQRVIIALVVLRTIALQAAIVRPVPLPLNPVQQDKHAHQQSCKE